jgi:hypothetical protein
VASCAADQQLVMSEVLGGRRPVRATEQSQYGSGNNRADVFDDHANCVSFLEAFAKTRDRYPSRLLGYRLMTNHFHLLLRLKAGHSISPTLRSFAVAHTSR